MSRISDLEEKVKELNAEIDAFNARVKEHVARSILYKHKLKKALEPKTYKKNLRKNFS